MKKVCRNCEYFKKDILYYCKNENIKEKFIHFSISHSGKIHNTRINFKPSREFGCTFWIQKKKEVK